MSAHRTTDITATVAPSSANACLTAALEEYRALLEKGERLDRDAFLAVHADAGPELADCLAGLEFVHAAVPSLSSASGSLAQALDQGTDAPATLGDFRILREIGRGGMGIVYEAEQLSLGRRVALKVLPFAATLDPRQLQRFHNEARAAASLRHEHIVPVYAVGQERGVHFFAMQFIDGQTMADLIRQQKAGANPGTVIETAVSGGAKIPVSHPSKPAADTEPVAGKSTEPIARDAAYFRRVAEWGIQAAEGLEHAHSLGIVHRDIKPGNLMIDAHGQLWVTDFGLARRATDSDLTMSGDLLGTLRYMSPEQALAKHDLVDHRSDVYSLGATLYEMLTMRPAVGGRDRVEILRNVAEQETAPPQKVNRSVPADLGTICLTCLQKDPAERYRSAEEMARDLKRWLNGDPIQARPVGRLSRAWRWSRRNPVLASLEAAILLAVAALAITSGLFWQQKERAEAAFKAEATQKQKAEAAYAAEAKQRRLARKAVKEMYTEVAERLLGNTPGMGAVQREFLLKALAYHEEFATEEGADPEIRFEAAWSNVRAGHIHWLLGQYDKAEKAYTRAERLVDALLADAPASPEYLDLSAQVLFQRSWVFQVVNRLPEGRADRRRSVEVYKRLATEFPSNAHFRRCHVHARVRQLWFLKAPDQAREAEAIGREALAMAEQLITDFPEHVSIREEVVFACHDLGMILINARRFQEAQPILGRGLRLCQDLSHEQPTNPGWREHVGHLAAQQAKCFSHLQQPEQACSAYRLALTQYGKLAADYPERPMYSRRVLAMATRLRDFPLSFDELQQVASDLDSALRAPHLKRADYVTALSALIWSANRTIMDTAATPARRQALEGYSTRIRDLIRKLDKEPPTDARSMDRLAWFLSTATLPKWQTSPDLSGVRDEQELAKLPEEERKSWRQLWADVERMRKQAAGLFKESSRFSGTVTPKERETVHEVKLKAGTTYVIDLESKAFDTFPRLEDAQGKKLTENNDINPGIDTNSRLVFTPQTDGLYRLVVSAFENQGVDPYILTIREFNDGAPKSK